jgi:iron(III) transport system ATP-binding protein
VARNIAYGLKGSREAKRRRVAEALALVGLSGLDRRMPHQLSGGQQQRVALARALAPAPAIMLLDEPFSNLDAGLRAQVREDVRRILKEAGISTVLVTHDQAEALSLADEVGVMLEGVLRQVAPPETLYREPASAAIARFVGDANFLPGQASGEVVRCSLGMLPLLRPAQGAVQVMLRSEMIGLTPASEGEGNARVVSVAYFGHDYLAQVQLNTPGGQDAALHVRLRAGQALAAGQPVQARVSGPVVAFPTES